MNEILNIIDKEIELKRNKDKYNKDVDEYKKNEEDKLVFPHNIPLDNLSLDTKILAPFAYSINVPGKNFRRALVKGLNYWLKAPQYIEDVVSESLYLMHNYSLMIDDIQDYSKLRRGQPCCHRIFGIPHTINMTCFLISYNANIILDLKDPMITRIHAEVAKEILRGQVMDIYWRDNFICPTEEEYKIMIMKKAGALFFYANNILQYYSKENVDVNYFLTAITLFFQINDDYQNLCSDYFYDSKGFCEDISEGKFSFPVVHVVHKYPKQGKEVLDILRQRTQDIELKRKCKSIIEKCGGIEYTRNVLKELWQVIIEESEKFGPNAYINENLFQKLIKQSL